MQAFWPAVRLLVALGALMFTSIASALVLVIQAPGDYETIREAVAAAPDHAIIEIAPGAYAESLVIDRPLRLRPAAGGEVLLAPPLDEPVITIEDTESVTIEGLSIVGGRYGIFVTRSQAITIKDNAVSGSRLVGIKVRLGAADILDNTVFHAQPPYGMGIHVTNTTQWPPSRVIGNLVFGQPLSGIYTNMTGMIEIMDNVVTGNGQHGIAVTEMSHADVFDNIVVDNAETGIQLLDMSIAHICDNIVSDTRGSSEAPQIRQGNGIIVDYHSEATLSGNTIQSSAQHGISILFGSTAFLHENSIQGSEAQSVFVDGSEALDGSGCA
ncbi:MAG: right-handed parallel beta-helix repeat-containing protein [Chloroflexota bacterium]|nr:right-handed parallel beta-helix repeat-containing protein [Chloroflexota bacterium]MDE2947972.1 right-handed parallel beta-helix repeat-containing protein [Chloroflexota bacterium]